jgi:heme/copper-type cytochrome/quinol oxidase subunit 2
MTTKTKIISYERQVQIFWTLVAICIISLSVYVWGINATTRNVASHQSLERELTQKVAELSSLEFDYIELKNEVTMELARSYGYSEVKDPIYVSRITSSNLSLNTFNR